MVHCCCVSGCRQRAEAGTCVSFHTFPKNETQRKKWIQVVGRKNWQPSLFTKICSEHFVESDFVRRFGQTKLNADAVPSVFDVPKKPWKVSPKLRQTRKRQSSFSPTSSSINEKCLSASKTMCLSSPSSDNADIPVAVLPSTSSIPLARPKLHQDAVPTMFPNSRKIKPRKKRRAEENQDLPITKNKKIDEVTSNLSDNFNFPSESNNTDNDAEPSLYIKSELEESPDLKFEIEENNIDESLELGEESSESCQRIIQENKDLREEVERLNLVVEDMKQELLLAKEREIRLEQTVQAVRDIVNKDIQTGIVNIKPEI